MLIYIILLYFQRIKENVVIKKKEKKKNTEKHIVSEDISFDNLSQKVNIILR